MNKDKAQLNVRIPKELDRKLEKHCVAADTTKTDIIKMLLVDYLKGGKK